MPSLAGPALVPLVGDQIPSSADRGPRLERPERASRVHLVVYAFWYAGVLCLALAPMLLPWVGSTGYVGLLSAFPLLAIGGMGVALHTLIYRNVNKTYGAAVAAIALATVIATGHVRAEFSREWYAGVRARDLQPFVDRLIASGGRGHLPVTDVRGDSTLVVADDTLEPFGSELDGLRIRVVDVTSRSVYIELDETPDLLVYVPAGASVAESTRDFKRNQGVIPLGNGWYRVAGWRDVW